MKTWKCPQNHELSIEVDTCPICHESNTVIDSTRLMKHECASCEHKFINNEKNYKEVNGNYCNVCMKKINKNLYEKKSVRFRNKLKEVFAITD